MPVKPILYLIPHAVTRPEHRPRRLSLPASVAAAATFIACPAAGSASAAPTSPARPGTAGSADFTGGEANPRSSTGGRQGLVDTAAGAAPERIIWAL
jgi:hypothetical protein